MIRAWIISELFTFRVLFSNSFTLLFTLFTFTETTAQRNEYQQFLTYQRNISIYDLKHWSIDFDKCVAESLGNVSYRAIGCMHQLQEKNKLAYPAIDDHPHWKSSSNWTSPDCHYDVKQISTSSDTIFLHLHVRQHNCFSKVHESHPGGSSFYVLSEGLYQQTCEVFDSQDNNYDIICFHQPMFMYRLPASPDHAYHSLNLDEIMNFHPHHHYFHQQWLERHHYCQWITIILDYEHYDAYSEYGSFLGYQHPLLRYKLLDRQVYCVDDVQLSPRSASLAAEVFSTLTYDAAISNEITNGCWQLKKSILSESRGRVNLYDSQTVSPYKSSDYEWKWETEFNPAYKDTNLSIDAYSLLRNDRQLSIRNENPACDYLYLGESHLRLIKDSLIAKVNPSELRALTAKHSNHVYENIGYHFAPFNYNLKEAILAHCNAATRNLTIIAQTGAWDLMTSFLSQILKYPKAAPALLGLIKDLVLPLTAKRSNSSAWFDSAMKEFNVHIRQWTSFLETSCRQNLQHLIWLDVMLYPDCLQRDREVYEKEVESCQKNRGGRNNYNILALDYFYEMSMVDIARAQQQESTESAHISHLEFLKQRKLHFLQTRKIFLPRLVNAPFYNSHFMIRTDFSSSVTTGEEGAVLIEAMIRLLGVLNS